MKTSEMLKALPPKHREYLEKLKSDIEIIKQHKDYAVANDYKNVGKGYIKCLVDCGVIDDFKTVWCWFTL